MTNNRGDITISGNFQVLKATSFDSRNVTDLKSDLVSIERWKAVDNNIYVYIGLLVSVTEDTEENNGLYYLKALPHTEESNWEKLGGTGGGSSAVTSVNSKTGAVVITKTDLDLGNVDNTADLNKPVSTATQTALDLKTNTADLSSVAISGEYDDLLNVPTLPVLTDVLATNEEWTTGTSTTKAPNISQVKTALNNINVAQATDTTLGTVKAIARTTETSQVAIDTNTGLLYSAAGGSSSSETYTNLTPSILTVGGLEKGSTFNAKTFTEMFDQMLSPEIGPSLEFAMVGPNKNYVEKGSVTDIPTKTLLIKGSDELDSLIFSKNDIEVHSIAPGPTITEVEYTFTDVAEGDVLSVMVTAGINNFFSNITIVGLYPILHGTTIVDTATSTELSTLAKTLGETVDLQSMYSGSLIYPIVAVPQSLGINITSIKDINGLELLYDFKKYAVDMVYGEGETAITETYQVYQQLNSITVTNFVYTYEGA